MRRVSRLFPRVGLVLLVGCSSTQVKACNEIFALSCGGCVLLSKEEVQDARELKALLDRCGSCDVGERCNLVAPSPRCAVDPGDVGVPCGVWRSANGTKQLAFECGSGLVCNGAFKPSQCMRAGRLRESCSVDSDCEPSLVCSRSEPRHCRPAHGVGEACDREGCAQGLVCNAGFHPPLCRAPGDVGDACWNGSDCRDGLWCRTGACAPGG